MLNLRRRSDSTKVFLISGIPSNERKDLAKKIQQLGGKYFEIDIFKAHCSHVICGRLSRSEKLLGALATGKWVMHPQYVHKSSIAETWLDEEQYEWCDQNVRRFVPSVSMEMALATRRWRTKLGGNMKSFTGWKVAILISAKRNETMKRLLVSGGAEVYTLKIPIRNPEKVANSIGYVFVSETNVGSVSLLFDYGVLCVQPEFIADYLIKDPPADPMDYLVQRVDPCSAPPLSQGDAGSQSFLHSSQQSFLSSTTVSPAKSITDSQIIPLSAGYASPTAASNARSFIHVSDSPFTPLPAASASRNVKSSGATVQQIPADSMTDVLYSRPFDINGNQTAGELPEASEDVSSIPAPADVEMKGDMSEIHCEEMFQASVVSNIDNLDFPSTPDHTGDTNGRTNMQTSTPIIAQVIQPSAFTCHSNKTRPVRQSRKGLPPKPVNMPTLSPIKKKRKVNSSVSVEETKVRRSSPRLQLEMSFINKANDNKQLSQSVDLPHDQLDANSDSEPANSFCRRVLQDHNILSPKNTKENNLLHNCFSNCTQNVKLQTELMKIKMDHRQRKTDSMAKRISKRLLNKALKGSKSRKCSCCNSSPEKVRISQSYENSVEGEAATLEQLARTEEQLEPVMEGEPSMPKQSCKSAQLSGDAQSSPSVNTNETHPDELSAGKQHNHETVSVSKSNTEEKSVYILNHESLDTADGPIRLSKRLQNKGPKPCTCMCCKTPEKSSSCRNTQMQNEKDRLHTCNDAPTTNSTHETSVNNTIAKNRSLSQLNNSETATSIENSHFESTSLLATSPTSESLNSQSSTIKKLFNYKCTNLEQSNTSGIHHLPGQTANHENTDEKNSKVKKLYNYKFTGIEHRNKVVNSCAPDKPASCENGETHKIKKSCNDQYTDVDADKHFVRRTAPVVRLARLKQTDAHIDKLEAKISHKCTDAELKNVKKKQITETGEKQANQVLPKKKCGSINKLNKCVVDIRKFFNPILKAETIDMIEESTCSSTAKDSLIANKEDTIDLSIISNTVLDGPGIVNKECYTHLVETDPLGKQYSDNQCSQTLEFCVPDIADSLCTNADNSETIDSPPIVTFQSTPRISETLPTSLVHLHALLTETEHRIQHLVDKHKVIVETEKRLVPVDQDHTPTAGVDSLEYVANIPVVQFRSDKCNMDMDNQTVGNDHETAVNAPVVELRADLVVAIDDECVSQSMYRGDQQACGTVERPSVGDQETAADRETVDEGPDTVLDGSETVVGDDVLQPQTPVARSSSISHRHRDTSTGKKRKSRHDVDLPRILRELKRQKNSHCRWKPSMVAVNYRDTEVPVDSVELSTTMTAIIDTHVDEQFTLSAIQELSAYVSQKYYPRMETVTCFLRQILVTATSQLEAQQAYLVLVRLIRLHPPTTPEIVNIFHCCDWPFLKEILSDLISNKGADSMSYNRMLALRFLVALFEQNLQRWLSETQKGSPIAASQNILLRIVWAPSYHIVINSRCWELLDFLADILLYLTSSDHPEMTRHLTELLGHVGWLVGMSAEICRVKEFGSLDGIKCLQCAFVHELARRVIAFGSIDTALLRALFTSLKLPWLCVGVCQQILNQMDDYLLAGDQLYDGKCISLSAIVSRFFYLLPRLQGDQLKSTPSSQKFVSPSTVQRHTETRADDNRVGQGELKRMVGKAQRKNAKGERPLHTACIHGNLPKLKELLEVPGIDVNIRDNAGWTPLHEACNHGNVQCVQELLKFVPAKTMEHFFLKDTVAWKKVDIQVCNEEGITPLHDAVLNGKTEVARVLLQHGSKLLSAKTCHGYTAVDLAETTDMYSLLTAHLPSHIQRSDSQDFSSLSQESFTTVLEETRRELPCDLLYDQALGADGTRLYADRRSLVAYIDLVTCLTQNYVRATNMQGITDKILAQSCASSYTPVRTTSRQMVVNNTNEMNDHTEVTTSEQVVDSNANEMKDETVVGLHGNKDVIVDNSEVQWEKVQIQDGKLVLKKRAISPCNNNSSDHVSVPVDVCVGKEDVRDTRADLRVVRHLHRHVDMYRSHLMKLCRPEDEGLVDRELLSLQCLVTSLQAVSSVN